MIRLVILLLLIATPTFAQDLVTPSDRVTSHVNIRSAPSTDAIEIGQLRPGESLPLVESVPRWYEVRLADGSTGFVAKSWTTITQLLAPKEEDELRIHFLNVGTGVAQSSNAPDPTRPRSLSIAGRPDSRQTGWIRWRSPTTSPTSERRLVGI